MKTVELATGCLWPRAKVGAKLQNPRPLKTPARLIQLGLALGFRDQKPEGRVRAASSKQTAPAAVLHKLAKAMPAAASDALTTRATGGALDDADRAAAWRVFLGAATDVNYAKLKDEALPDAASVGGNSDPLSGLLDDAPSDGWARFHANVETRDEVRRDLERLIIDGLPEAHFRDPRRQARMLGVLTVWASKNDLGYRQGMHELLALICEALEQERAHGGEGFAQSGVVNEGPFSESDAYVLFDALMGHQSELFATDRGTEAPILILCKRFQQEASDLLSLGGGFNSVEPQLYGLRWARLLFCREVAFPAILKLWDGLFALRHAHQTSLSVVTEKACTALVCAAAPNLRGGSNDQVALETLMRYRQHVAPAVPRLLDIAARLVDGRGLPPVRAAAPAPRRQAPVQRQVPVRAPRPAAIPRRAPAGPPPGSSTSTPLFAPTPARVMPPPPGTLDPPSVVPSSRLLRAVAVLRGSAASEEGRRQAALAQIEEVAAELRRRRL